MQIAGIGESGAPIRTPVRPKHISRVILSLIVSWPGPPKRTILYLNLSWSGPPIRFICICMYLYMRYMYFYVLSLINKHFCSLCSMPQALVFPAKRPILDFRSMLYLRNHRFVHFLGFAPCAACRRRCFPENKKTRSWICLY